MDDISKIINRDYPIKDEIPKIKKVLSHLSLAKIDRQYSFFKKCCHSGNNISSSITSLLEELFNTPMVR